MSRRLTLLALAGTLLLALASAAPAPAASSVKAPSTTVLPTGPCDEDHVLDWEIINGVMYECACDHMMFGKPVCEWQEILAQAQDPQAYRRIVKWIKAKRLHLVVRTVRVAKVVTA